MQRAGSAIAQGYKDVNDFGNDLGDAFAHHVASIPVGLGTRQYQLDAMVHEGCSGGPLVDRVSKQVIGIVAGRFSPVGNQGGVLIGGRPLGTESSISYATCIEHGIELLATEIGA